MELDVCAAAPADWCVRAIGDVCKVTSGGTPSRRRPEFYELGKWPWVKTQELHDTWLDDTEEHITENAVSRSAAKVLPARAVLVAMYGATVGQLGILRRAMTCNQACCALLADDSKVDYRYVFYQLLNARQQLKSLASGAAQQNLSGVFIKSLELPFPSIAEQRVIAHILGTLDDKIELNRRTSATLEAMARALFQSWFVDFDPVRAKLDGRWQRGQSLPGLPAHLYDLFPDRLVDSELREIPEGWPIKPLGDVTDVVKGTSYKSEELVESDTALVTLKSFERDGGYRTDGLKAFCGTFKAEQVVRPGEVVLACTDVTQKALLVGRTAMVHADPRYTTLVASLDTLILRPKAASPLSKPFLYLLGRTEAFVQHNYAHTSGTTVIHLARDAVPTFDLVLPASGLMRAFDAVARPLLDKMLWFDGQSRILSTLRDTLLPKLISGELRVKDAERFVAASDVLALEGQVDIDPGYDYKAARSRAADDRGIP